MQHNIGHKKFNIYTMALGYHNDDDLIKEYNDTGCATTGIWHWVLLDELNLLEGNEIKSFIDTLKSFSKPKSKCSNYKCIYAFDLGANISFVLPELLKELTFKADIEDDDINVFNIICSDSLSDVWDLKIKFHKGKNLIIFRDIAKILANPKLKDLAKALNFDYNSILYNEHINRRVEGFEPSKDDLNAIRRKAQLLLEVVQHHKDDKYFFKSTSAASYSFRKGLDFAYKGSLKPYTEFRKEYPELDRDEHDFASKSIEGGLTFVNEFYKGKEQANVFHCDEHQAYPAKVVKCKMPYGKGIHKTKYIELDSSFNGVLFPGNYTICKCRVNVQFRLVPFRRNLGSDLMDVVVYCWDFEIPYLFKCYNYAEVAIEEMYIYKTKYSKFGGYFVDNYRQRLISRKQNNDYGVMYFKLLNNSFYGKLGEKPYNTIRIPHCDSLGNTYIEKIEKPLEEQSYLSTYTYAPMFSCIMALQRCEMMEGIFKIGLAHYYYCATDSHFTDISLESMTYFKSLEHRDFIGCWDDGEELAKAEFVGERRYKTLTKLNETIIHNSGFTYDKGEVYKDVDLENDVRAVNTKVRVLGGTMVVPITKTITSSEDFEEEMQRQAISHHRYLHKLQENEAINDATQHLRWSLSKGYIQR